MVCPMQARTRGPQTTAPGTDSGARSSGMKMAAREGNSETLGDGGNKERAEAGGAGRAEHQEARQRRRAEALGASAARRDGEG